jgi:hypothetical protein
MGSASFRAFIADGAATRYDCEASNLVESSTALGTRPLLVHGSIVPILSTGMATLEPTDSQEGSSIVTSCGSEYDSDDHVSPHRFQNSEQKFRSNINVFCSGKLIHSPISISVSAVFPYVRELELPRAESCRKLTGCPSHFSRSGEPNNESYPPIRYALISVRVPCLGVTKTLRKSLPDATSPT